MNFTVTYLPEDGDYVTQSIMAFDIDCALEYAHDEAISRCYIVDSIADSTGKTVWYRDDD